MKNKLTLFAAGAWVAVLCSPVVEADIFSPLPDYHVGAKHFLFTGTQTTHAFSEEGIPTPDGFGFRNAKGSSELTLSIPGLEITDLVIPLVIDANADRDADGNGTSWGGQSYFIDEKIAGQIYFTGVDHKISDARTTHIRQFGGNLWGGPLDGAHLLGTETIEETTDIDGTVISAVSTINGVLIVSWYEGFAPFEGRSDLPPLKPISELPAGLGWRPYTWTGRDYHTDTDHFWLITVEELDILDLRFRLHVTTEGPTEGLVPIRLRAELTALGHVEESFGAISGMGVLGDGGGSTPRLRAYHENLGAFWSGPFAGCLIMSNRGPSNLDSGLLLVPDYVDLGAPQKMLNVSERGRVGVGDDVLIAGFVVSGNLPKMMLVRGVGPGLADYGVTDFLVDPILEVYRATDAGPVLVGSNDNWGTDDGITEIQTATTQVGAFPLAMESKDAAIVFSWLEPGAYTVKVLGADETTGVALAEVYEIGN